MDALLWTGNGTTQNITTANFQPDWLWVKERSEARSNLVWDAVRGSNLGLITNTTSAESAQPSFTGFLSNGFGVSNTDSSDITNKNAQTYVGWIWKANGAGSSNTAGSITSTVSVNTTAGFSIVTWTFSAANSTVGHGLGVAPKMIIAKDKTSGASNWVVWHSALSASSGEYLVLNGTNATGTLSTIWGGVNPTSTTFGQGSGVGVPTNTCVAYCFAQVAGYSAFGSYTGNGSSDGPFVFTGFRPRFVMFKRTDSTANWWMIDTSRSSFNQMADVLLADSSGAEFTSGTGWPGIDYLSNGFKLRGTASGINASGGTYIYMAFAENPFKIARGR
jgi:hypothetical protein